MHSFKVKTPIPPILVIIIAVWSLLKEIFKYLSKPPTSFFFVSIHVEKKNSYDMCGYYTEWQLDIKIEKISTTQANNAGSDF